VVDVQHKKLLTVPLMTLVALLTVNEALETDLLDHVDDFFLVVLESKTVLHVGPEN
jgi:hypothetical protein